jgi:NAD-dependent deacetylase
VYIITQNVDNLHERAGSSNVLHLHGELMKVTSSDNPNDESQIIELDTDHLEVEYGEEAPDGSPLRPYIVWFGESVPNIDVAADICSNADIMLVVGTSLNVYPAAGLTSCAPPDIPIYLVDPASVRWNSQSKVNHIQMGASKGIAEFIKQQNLK